jgi:glycosyltransferase involved in cell wall biosynthesis
MKVLFVSSANIFPINSKVKNQGESLRKQGIEIEYFLIKGKGFFGYLRNIPRIKKYLKIHGFDIVHAHYSLCGYVCSLARAKPLVVSLMGSDVLVGFLWKKVIGVFHRFSWDVTIVKSAKMKETVNFPEAVVIPNGVDIDRFKFIERETACREVHFDPGKKHIIFVGYTELPVKNFKLVEEAYRLLNDTDVELNIVCGVAHDLIPNYMYAADVLLLTSLHEGSPNVIKEAMACGCPIVTTDVGDVREITGNTEGCFIATYEPGDVAEKIRLAIDFGKRTAGRKRLISLGLDEATTAKRIIDLYKSVVKKEKKGTVKKNKKNSKKVLTT